MIESLSKVLIANGLDPDSFIASAGEEEIFRGELPAGRVVETWMKLAKAAKPLPASSVPLNVNEGMVASPLTVFSAIKRTPFLGVT